MPVPGRRSWKSGAQDDLGCCDAQMACGPQRAADTVSVERQRDVRRAGTSGRYGRTRSVATRGK